jgi:hypothetical protein
MRWASKRSAHRETGRRCGGKGEREGREGENKEVIPDKGAAQDLRGQKPATATRDTGSRLSIFDSIRSGGGPSHEAGKISAARGTRTVGPLGAREDSRDGGEKFSDP